MQGYSLDIRERIVKAVIEENQNVTEVAKRFSVSRWTVQRYVRRSEAGQLAATKQRSRPMKLNEAGFKLLREQVEEHKDWTLEKHAEVLSQKLGIEFKKSVIGKYLKLMKISFKKDILSSRT